MKNIALYYPWIYLTSGIERTILEIAQNSRHKYTIFTNHLDVKHTYPELSKLKIVQLTPVPVSRDIFSVLKAAATIATQKIDLTSFNALMVHCDGLGDLIRIRNHSLPAICICHTPLRLAFDNQYAAVARSKANFASQIVYSTFTSAFKKIDRQLWQTYSQIIFNSQETYHRALAGKLISSSPKNVSVIHPGIHWGKIKLSQTYLPYFLLPGRIMWTKNVELGINAFIKAKNKQLIPAKFKLIIAGQVDAKSASYFSHLQNLSANRTDIQFITSPSETQLAKLYSHSWVSLCCSFNEDWGLTCLEAGAHAKPVIAVNSGGPAEIILPQKTGLLIRNDVDSLTAALTQLANNRQLVKKMGQAGRVRVKQFTWEKFIRQLDKIIDSL